MALCVVVDLGPGDFVLDGDPSPPQKGPSLWRLNGCMD